MNIKWDSEKYTQSFDFVHKQSEGLIELIDADKGSFVVDLGCGNGALTEALHSAGYNVLGIDDSNEMIEKAKELRPDIEFAKGNALNFSLDEKADVIFSNAVFHWIEAAKQDKLVKNLRANLKKGGELICEFGGATGVDVALSAIKKVLSNNGIDYKPTFYFPTISEYTTLLEQNGFLVEYAALFPRPSIQKEERGLVDWIEMFITEPFKSMDDELKFKIYEEIEQNAAPELYTKVGWLIDYVMIRVKAKRVE